MVRHGRNECNRARRFGRCVMNRDTLLRDPASSLSVVLWLSFTALMAMVVVEGCNPAPPYPIHFGGVECAYCHMVVSDPRFAAELVTKKGRVYYFDSIECLASFVAESQVPQADVHSMWVSDFQHPEHLIPAPSAFYLKASRLHSPMRRNFIAFSHSADRTQALATLGGTQMSWEEVLQLQRTHSRANTTLRAS